MIRVLLIGMALMAWLSGTWLYAQDAETDIISTDQGDLKLTLIGHASLMFAYGGKIIHVDPWTMVADYTSLPKADLILITHQHRDHLDMAALKQIVKNDTRVVMTQKCLDQIEDMPWDVILMANGDKKQLMGCSIEAIPAYNLVHKRETGMPYHPKGEGNGYIITFADKRIYVAGDTENTPEMKALENIDAAFVPMNLPYTMDAAMAADAVRAFKPKRVYPYHTRSKQEDQVPGFIKLMAGCDGVQIRILK